MTHFRHIVGIVLLISAALMWTSPAIARIGESNAAKSLKAEENRKKKQQEQARRRKAEEDVAKAEKAALAAGKTTMTYQRGETLGAVQVGVAPDGEPVLRRIEYGVLWPTPIA